MYTFMNNQDKSIHIDLNELIPNYNQNNHVFILINHFLKETLHQTLYFNKTFL